MRHFNAKVTDGRIPLVLTPGYASIMTLAMRVPSGLYVWSLARRCWCSCP
jgi:hypothetical protein